MLPSRFHSKSPPCSIYQGGALSAGKFVLTEQRPQMRSRVEVVPIRHGDDVIFPVDHRLVPDAKRTFRTRMRHGVSRIRSWARHTLGINSTIRPDRTQFSEVDRPSQRNLATPRSAASRKRSAGTDRAKPALPKSGLHRDKQRYRRLADCY